jgi:hypothetical protein
MRTIYLAAPSWCVATPAIGHLLEGRGADAQPDVPRE